MKGVDQGPGPTKKERSLANLRYSLYVSRGGPPPLIALRTWSLLAISGEKRSLGVRIVFTVLLFRGGFDVFFCLAPHVIIHGLGKGRGTWSKHRTGRSVSILTVLCLLIIDLFCYVNYIWHGEFLKCFFVSCLQTTSCCW